VTFDDEAQMWRFDGTGKAVWLGNVPCYKCDRLPTPEGFDACLGYIEGASSACCGHGVEAPYIVATALVRFVWDDASGWHYAAGLEGAYR
jgi:hypothetical protein